MPVFTPTEYTAPSHKPEETLSFSVQVSRGAPVGTHAFTAIVTLPDGQSDTGDFKFTVRTPSP
jgi:hypothetical protein